MKYAVNQSKTKVRNAFDSLLVKVNEHIKLLSSENMPITTIIGFKRQLLISKNIVKTVFKKKEKEYHLKEHKINDTLQTYINDVIDKYGVDLYDAVSLGVVKDYQIKKVLLLYDYHVARKTKGNKHLAIREQLAMKYDVSTSFVDKAIYNENKR